MGRNPPSSLRSTHTTMGAPAALSRTAPILAPHCTRTNAMFGIGILADCLSRRPDPHRTQGTHPMSPRRATRLAPSRAGVIVRGVARWRRLMTLDGTHVTEPPCFPQFDPSVDRRFAGRTASRPRPPVAPALPARSTSPRSYPPHSLRFPASPKPGSCKPTPKWCSFRFQPAFSRWRDFTRSAAYLGCASAPHAATFQSSTSAAA
jgi:hypothetical protein